MARRVARPCNVPGCPSIAIPGGGRCQVHEREHRRVVDLKRPSSSARGYGARWRRIRAAYLRVHPICAVEGCGQPATNVDHIIPRPDGSDRWDNLQGLCSRHHSIKTARDDGGWGNGRRNR